MKRLISGVIALAAVVLTGGPASAAHLSMSDPAGDRSGHGLDLTGATLRNLGERIVVDVEFVRSVRGDLIVSVDPRHARGVRLVSEYDPVGHTRNRVLAGSFGDHDTGEEPERVPCRGFRVRWSADEPTVRLIMPASCLTGGDYTAVRFAVLTERDGDTDYLPDETGQSPWVPRG
ncbi:hypothetical protein [Nocardioides sp. HB32]